MALVPVSVANRVGTATPMAAHQDAGGSNIPVVTLDSTKATYRAAAAKVVLYATGAVTLLSITGSATKTIRIKKIAVGLQTDAVLSVPYKLIRGSALGSGGTAVTPTVAKMNTGSGAASAVVKHYTTAAQTAGTTAEGPLGAGVLPSLIGTSVAGQQVQTIFPEPGATAGAAIVLRGTSEILELQNLNGSNLAANPYMSYVVEWEEDAS